MRWTLPPERVPAAWFNVIPHLPTPLQPPLHPGTKESVGPDDSRILFMVEDGHDRTIGHMGLAFIDWETGYAEADAVVRGDEAPTGLLTESLDTMWRWARGALGLSRLGVRVRSDNPAIVFYDATGQARTILGSTTLVGSHVNENGVAEKAPASSIVLFDRAGKLLFRQP